MGGPGKKERRGERGREQDTQRVLSAGLRLGGTRLAEVDRLRWTGCSGQIGMDRCPHWLRWTDWDGQAEMDRRPHCWLTAVGRCPDSSV